MRQIWVLLSPGVANFCSSRRGRADFHDVVIDPLDSNLVNRKVSGLAFNKNQSHLFTVADDMEISVLTDQETQYKKIITITGVAMSEGWDAIVSRPCIYNSRKDCMLIGAIGNGCSSAHTLRFVEFDELTEQELNSTEDVRKEGTQYDFSYPDGRRFDAQGLVMSPDRQQMFVITSNTEIYSYAHMFKVVFGRVVKLEERAVFDVGTVSVTDATSTPRYLVFRTTDGILLYSWEDLCDASQMKSQHIEYLKEGHGKQKALAYRDGEFFFIGAGNEHVFVRPCYEAEELGNSSAHASSPAQCLRPKIDSAQACPARANPNPKSAATNPISAAKDRTDHSDDDISNGRVIELVIVGIAAGTVIAAMIAVIICLQKKKKNTVAAPNTSKPSFLVHHLKQPITYNTPRERARQRDHRDRERHHPRTETATLHYSRRFRQPESHFSQLVAPNFG